MDLVWSQVCRTLLHPSIVLHSLPFFHFLTFLFIHLSNHPPTHCLPFYLSPPSTLLPFHPSTLPANHLSAFHPSLELGIFVSVLALCNAFVVHGNKPHAISQSGREVLALPLCKQMLLGNTCVETCCRFCRTWGFWLWSWDLALEIKKGQITLTVNAIGNVKQNKALPIRWCLSQQNPPNFSSHTLTVRWFWRVQR